MCVSYPCMHDAASPPPMPQIQFTCDATQTPGAISGVIYGSDQCKFVATFPTSFACPGAAGGSSSGAWAFNGIVLIGGFVYFAGGFVYLWKAKGAEGNDRIPHYAFWSDLPALVKDGCVYFVYLCKLALFKVGISAQQPESPVAYASHPAAYDSSTGIVCSVFVRGACECMCIAYHVVRPCCFVSLPCRRGRRCLHRVACVGHDVERRLRCRRVWCNRLESVRLDLRQCCVCRVEVV